MSFPALDPIPLPAPIWLMKLLSHVTLALHFAAVMILTGSLALICFHNARGRKRGDLDQISTSYVLARRLPVVMTYVINLGVPPLLFAQTLYGRAIYSSSVLIGAMWLSVIFLVMLDYWLLYRLSGAIEMGRSGVVLALSALLITMGIGQIYAMNMTLMLRPEVWQAMYAHSPSGLQGVHGDPTVTPRWLFVMSGGLVFGGLWALALSNLGSVTDGIRRHLRKSGGVLTAAGVVAQIVCAYLAVASQPDAVREGLGASLLWRVSGGLFLVASAGAAALALYQGLGVRSNALLGTLGLTLGFLGTTGAVIFRDGIRDVTLSLKGFDVWKQPEASNWSVIGLFLLLFVIMLGVLVWLLMVIRRAKVPNEQVTP